MTYRHAIATLLLLLSMLTQAEGQTLGSRYTRERPVVIVCDWDKPPYEFLSDKGEPAGSNIDIIRAVMDELELPYRFVMKEWTIALKTFERGQADIILANARRYNAGEYAISSNIVNYNRIRVAMIGDSTSMITFRQLEREGVVFKPGDYSAFYFNDGDTTYTVQNIEFQSPKVALMGVANGDYKYYVWGEEPLKWKLKELNLSGITLNDVGIPISEIHFVGRDRELIEEVDDQFSRLKQRGDVAQIQTHWLHPEQEEPGSTPTVLLVISAILIAAAIAYAISRLTKAHVSAATRDYTELNDMMTKALHMGSFNFQVEEDETIQDFAALYDHLVNMPFLGMSFYDKDGWLISINDSMKQLCGISDDSPETKRYWESVNMYDVNNFRSVYTPEDSGDAIVCQHLCLPETGIDKYIEIGVRPLLNIDGEIVNYLISAFDITDEHDDDHRKHLLERRLRQLAGDIALQKRRLHFMLHELPDENELDNARQQLRQKSDEAAQSVSRKSGFMASMTHELRTPLNAILGFSSVLHSMGDEPGRSDYVRIVRNSSDMLQRLINDIIEASHISEGAPMVIKPKNVDFPILFDDMCTALRQRVQNPDVEFIKENPYDHLYITVDTERIMQVLTNFVTNAVKFTTNGHIRVGYEYLQRSTSNVQRLTSNPQRSTSNVQRSTFNVQPGLFLFCEDTGLGIPPDKQEVIFNRFVKLDEFVQGTGMGLAISKSIAESCGGRIGVESSGPGPGSTFWIWVPSSTV